MPIALPDFVGGSAADGEIARNVTGIITNNLRRSGLFAPIDPAAFIEKITNPDAVPRFPDWRADQRAGAGRPAVSRARATDG